MKKIILLASLVIISFSCKEKVSNNEEEVAEAEPMTENAQDTTQEEWIILFDGTSMEHWRGYLKEEMPAEWSIEEDAMAFTPGTEGGKNIISKDTFTNFVLSIDWKIAEGGNSGIFWGVFEDPKFPEAYQTGPEIQVLDDAKHPDSFVGNGTHKAGALYDMIAPNNLEAVKPAGEWNTCVIEVNHNTNRGKVTLNGIEIVTFPVNGEAWDAMVENSKFKDWEGFGNYPTGHIALQDHGDKVWYKNIKIKKLD
ncbi:MAG: DUF1080 domain-containing protein [Flavobacteriaceae bacterium]